MEKRFLETNLYHQMARNWLKSRMPYEEIFTYLNNIGKQIQQHLEWKQRKPYIRQGHQDLVKEYLLKHIPKPRETEYLFF